MAHPMRKSSREGHNEKLKRMTEDYGSADAAANKLAPVNDRMSEGGMDSVGFGADAAMAKPRGDRPARKSAAANPLATYRKGGRVKHRDDGGSVSAIEAANKAQSESAPGRARGGRMKHKGTHVNVIIAPQGGSPAPAASPLAAMPPGAPGGLPPAPPKPPMAPPMGAGPGMPPGANPIMAGAPGGLPPGMIPPRATGGRIEETLKNEGLVRSDKQAKVRASGGAVEGITTHGLKGNAGKIKMDDGSVSGPGRLEKVAARERNAKSERAQAV